MFGNAVSVSEAQKTLSFGDLNFSLQTKPDGRSINSNCSSGGAVLESSDRPPAEVICYRRRKFLCGSFGDLLYFFAFSLNVASVGKFVWRMK